MPSPESSSGGGHEVLAQRLASVLSEIDKLESERDTIAQELYESMISRTGEAVHLGGIAEFELTPVVQGDGNQSWDWNIAEFELAPNLYQVIGGETDGKGEYFVVVDASGGGRYALEIRKISF